MAPDISVADLTFRYYANSPPVFSRYSLDIPAKTCCAILGPTGSGKTTLLSVISGIAGSQLKTASAEGTVRIGLESYAPLPRRILFPKVGFALQEPSVQISGVKNTVRSELGFTLENLGVHPAERGPRVDETLRLFGLERLAERNPFHLSGGEMQRVALASILVAAPSILLLDEPTGALDWPSQKRLKSLLRSLKTTTTIVFTDYTIEFALNLADVIVVMENGRNVFVGNQREFLDSLSSFDHLLPLTAWKELIESAAWETARNNLK